MAAWAYTCSFLAVPVRGFLSLGLTERSLFGVAGWRILLLIGAFGGLAGGGPRGDGSVS